MFFNKVLIANRGEIAVRLIRACHELGIAAVAVYSEVDRNALHVRLADEAYPIGPAAAPESYLHIAHIIEAAQRSGAQAVHPGYGFLSEQAPFARACRAAGLVFIGPTPEAIELMGSKIAVKRLAQSVGVPTVPGYMGDEQGIERLRHEAERIGFPLLIKASAGGGGKGMRTVHRLDEFAAAVEGAQRESRAAFGDDTVFIERLIARPRHVEIQVLADMHGHCIHLFERECSIQRRHQKIVEESPSPALTPALRTEMGAAAVRLAQAANYYNAGTIEFMLDEDGRFYFLEMNTRLQVEHPVTELVTGLDLVQLQIAIAAGTMLPFTQDDLLQRGHACEVRVYAEDPLTFLPSTGTVAVFAPPEGPGIRNDTGLESDDEVTVYYDPMLAKLIVHAPDRPAAVARLRRALDEYVVLGVTTNLALLRAIVGHPAFLAGTTTTDFLTSNDVHIPTQSSVPSKVLAAAALLDLRSTPSHQPLSPDPWQGGPWQLMRNNLRLRYTNSDDILVVAVSQQTDNWQIDVAGDLLDIMIISEQPHLLTLVDRNETNQLIERFWFVHEGNDRLISWRGANYHLKRVLPPDVDTLGGRTGRAAGHTGMEAPMPGTVIKVLVQEGQEVVAHQPLVVLEAMKMEHTVAAPYNGIIRRLHYAPGALVAKGAILVDVEKHIANPSRLS